MCKHAVRPPHASTTTQGTATGVPASASRGERGGGRCRYGGEGAARSRRRGYGTEAETHPMASSSVIVAVGRTRDRGGTQVVGEGIAATAAAQDAPHFVCWLCSQRWPGSDGEWNELSLLGMGRIVLRDRWRRRAGRPRTSIRVVILAGTLVCWWRLTLSNRNNNNNVKGS